MITTFSRSQRKFHLFTNNNTLHVESSVIKMSCRKEKYFISERFFAKQLILSAHVSRGRYRSTSASKMEHFVIRLNGFQTLAAVAKNSIFDRAEILEPPPVTKLNGNRDH